ncbi:simple sugar transport system ATP-binding protein [Rhizobium sp. BK226]|uniref:ABC transporter ATP-binding protein n=1 Tax=Rhizobium TaxID=379 RepID=UPI0016188BBE|nr:MULTISPECIES: ABC transporter ATP-binding protein [Rhizobium]MBB4112297.1 simple sugar transport system ATP-binding protein [Rhizobium sp. BK226]UTS88642.1 ABC transporter ATP-binding protein [Rhizobium anhuiense bv. trifolii]
MTGPVLEITGVSKRFGANLANDDISMTLAKGEVVALLGENGAGKTTLMSILFGHYMPDAGRILIEGREVPQGKPRAAIQAGVGMVHQHFSLAPNLTVLENVMTGTERLWSWRSGTSAARKKLLTISERFGLKVDPDARLGDLSVGEQQRVEILKALYNDARILILDEPTAVLTNIEAERLFTTLREMARQGLSLIFISHKLDEVMAAADRIVVLRGGKMVAERKTSDTSKEELAELMVGHRVTRPVREPSTAGAIALEAADVTVRSGGVDRLKSISFRLHAGEILGIIGVSGNGQATLAHLLSGMLARSAGDLLLFGEAVGNLGVADVVDAGIGRIPEDRNEEGVIGEMAIWENAVLERIASSAFSRRGLVNRKAGMAFAREIIDGFDVRGGGPAIRTRLLSGGNMQKLILGRNLHRRPRILIAAQPARGLDEGAVAAVHARLLEARRQGTAVLLISEDLDEVIALADRIQAIVGGRLSPPVEAEDADARRLGLMMAGEWQQNPEAGHAI